MLIVALVEPEGEENVGQVSRAMMNMGAEKLYLINPKCDHLSKKAMDYSVHAQEILRKAEIFSTLEETLKGADISIAVSRRVGQWRKRDIWSYELGEYLKDFTDRKVALVFGREQTGLSNEEIRGCDLICSIPSSDEFPSLNLAHAVMLILYEVYKSDIQLDEEASKLANREEFDSMIEQMMTTLDGLEFFKNVPQWRLKNYMNKLLMRAKPDSFDVRAVRKIFYRIDAITKRMKKDSEK